MRELPDEFYGVALRQPPAFQLPNDILDEIDRHAFLSDGLKS
jgi:hypothetical protein